MTPGGFYMKKISYIKDFEEWKKEFEFSIPIEIRFSEVDMLGHMNNVSPFNYFQEARIKYLSSLNVFGNFQDAEHVAVVADLQCDYLQQVYFGQSIELYVKTNSVGKSSFDIHYMGLTEDGSVCLTGRGRLVNIEVKTGKPASIDEKTKESLRRTKKDGRLNKSIQS